MTNQQKLVEGGLLIIFEGIDGVGKTTQLKLAEGKLKKQGWLVYTTRNLGGSLIGEELRNVILKPIERPPKTNLYIGVAIQEALIEVINEQREKGSLILLDRGPISMAAYQGYGSNVDKRLCWQHAEDGLKALKPELTLIYQADIKTAIKRARLVSGKADYFESKPKHYFNDVLKGFKVGAQRYGALTIDANGTIDQIHNETMAYIGRLLQTKSPSA